MKKKFLLLPALFVFIAANLSAQQLRLDSRPPVIINGNVLQNPWTGGANSPVFSEMDLNGDGKMDLITFDAVGNRLSTYLNIGTPGNSAYRYAPQYLSKFPIMHGWVLTYDFDCDGDMDLLAYGSGAMMAYRNNYTPATGIKFSLVSNQINTYYGNLPTNLYVNQVTIPALIDADGDGDMDVFEFSIGGSWVEYHKNYAMDSTGYCDGFLFHVQYNPSSLIPEMWGHFYLSGFANKATLGVQKPAPVDDEIINHNRLANSSQHLHSGSALYAFDYECDGDVDLLNGDLVSTTGNLLFLQNGAPPDSMVYQDTLFPSYNTPVLLANVPRSALIDVNNDGVKDMIVTPFANVGEDYYNVLLYNNQTDNCNPDYHFSTNRFLVDQTIDVGTSSRVAFFDVDADGLQDMLISNYDIYDSNPLLTYSRIAYFRNTGTATYPMFTLINSDYANCSSLAVLGLHPTFGDIDGDGDKDMIMGVEDGSLIYYENQASSGNPPQFVFQAGLYQSIDVGNNSAPQLIDVDRDGLLDLLIGERSGNLNYYHNTGSATVPVFTYVSNIFGGVNVIKSNAVQGNSTPLLVDRNGSYELLVGSESGYIYQYNNIDGNLTDTFNLVDSTYQNIFEPSHATIAMADIDGDNKFDLLIGNEDGGVCLYTQRNPHIVNPVPHSTSHIFDRMVDDKTLTNDAPFSLYPSPANGVLNLQFNTGYETEQVAVSILNVLGKEVLQVNNINASTQFDIHTLNAGVYFVHIHAIGGVSVLKFIKQ